MSEQDDYSAVLQQQVLDAFGLKAWDAGLAPAPLRVRAWRTATLARRRGKVIDWDAYNAAEAEYQAREEAFRAALPGRVQAIADHLSEELPPGMRFEMGPPGGWH